jgi:hypothetical protein
LTFQRIHANILNLASFIRLKVAVKRLRLLGYFSPSFDSRTKVESSSDVLLSNIPKVIVKGEDGFEDLFTAGPTPNPNPNPKIRFSHSFSSGISAPVNLSLYAYN